MSSTTLFSIEDLELVFSEEGESQALRIADEVRNMKDALNGALWHNYKTLRGDFDSYTYWWSQIISKLHDGPLVGYKRADGGDILQWKPMVIQHQVLTDACKALKLDANKQQKYIKIHRDRIEKRVNYSGSQGEREAFEGVREQKGYAPADNDASHAEQDMKRFVIQNWRKYNGIDAVEDALGDGKITQSEANALVLHLKKLSRV